MRYHRSVVPMRIYLLRHGESFNPSLLLFLFHLLAKKAREKTKEGVDRLSRLLFNMSHKDSRMHVNIIISVPMVNTVNERDVIAMY